VLEEAPEEVLEVEEPQEGRLEAPLEDEVEVESLPQ